MKRPPGTAATRKALADRVRLEVLAVVAAIPEGRVTTYGTIARHLRVGPRQVARVLATLTPEESAELPWYRVVAANGVIRVGRRQAARLRAEGVAVTARYKVDDFAAAAWQPRPGSPG